MSRISNYLFTPVLQDICSAVLEPLMCSGAGGPTPPILGAIFLEDVKLYALFKSGALTYTDNTAIGIAQVLEL